jgi:hypothetical protein
MGYEGLKGAIHRSWSREENCRVRMAERETWRWQDAQVKQDGRITSVRAEEESGASSWTHCTHATMAPPCPCISHRSLLLLRGLGRSVARVSRAVRYHIYWMEFGDGLGWNRTWAVYGWEIELGLADTFEATKDLNGNQERISTTRSLVRLLKEHPLLKSIFLCLMQGKLKLWWNTNTWNFACCS